MTDVTLLIAGEGLPNSVHLPANSGELRQHGLGKNAIFVEPRQSGLGDAIELLATLGFDRGVADLFEVGEGRIDHTRTRRVEALGRFFKRLDDLVPMTGALLKQSQNHQLELTRAQLAPSKEAAPAEPSAVAERRPEPPKMPAVRPPCAAVITKETMHF